MRSASGVAQLNHLQKSYEDYQIYQIGKNNWFLGKDIECSMFGNLNKKIELILKVLQNEDSYFQ
jgi:hypothetical protein